MCLMSMFFCDGSKEVSDGVWCHAVNILKCFMLLADFKDAVSSGYGDHLAIIRKQLLNSNATVNWKGDKGRNIEILK